MTDEAFRPAIEAPYRWRDWASDPNGRTGEALLTFVNGELLPTFGDCPAQERMTHATCWQRCSRKHTTGCCRVTCCGTS